MSLTDKLIGILLVFICQMIISEGWEIKLKIEEIRLFTFILDVCLFKGSEAKGYDICG